MKNAQPVFLFEQARPQTLNMLPSPRASPQTLAVLRVLSLAYPNKNIGDGSLTNRVYPF